MYIRNSSAKNGSLPWGTELEMGRQQLGIFSLSKEKKISLGYFFPP